MDLSITEFQKGTKLLEKIFRGEIDPKGCKKAFNKKGLHAIISGGRSVFFDTLDRAGEHLRASRHTRYTSHKANDFSSIQAKSSLELQKFYQNMQKTMQIPAKPLQPISREYQEIDNLELDNDELQNTLKSLNTKIEKEIKNVQSLVSKIPSMRRSSLATQLKEIKGTPLEKEYMENLKNIISGFDNDIAFTDEDKKVLPSKSVRTLFKGSQIAGGGLSVAGITASALLTTSVIGGVTGGVGAAVVIGCGVVVVATLGLGALACANSKRMQEIDAKRFQGLIYDHMRKIVKYTNEANRACQEYNGKYDDGDIIIITDKHKKLTNEFINKQKILWKKYADSTQREYKNDKSGKHTSGILKRSDNRERDKVQRAKLALANTWINLKTQF